MPQHEHLAAKKKELARRRFIKELARFLTKDQAAKGIRLQMESNQREKGGEDGTKYLSLAIEWASLRNISPLHGYVTEEEAEATLLKFLE